MKSRDQKSWQEIFDGPKLAKKLMGTKRNTKRV
jgi:hypothetical protein